MSKGDTPGRNIEGGMNIDFMRSLVKQYSELVSILVVIKVKITM